MIHNLCNIKTVYALVTTAESAALRHRLYKLASTSCHRNVYVSATDLYKYSIQMPYLLFTSNHIM